MELKFIYIRDTETKTICSNRTFMELKYVIFGINIIYLAGVLIAPLWN